MNQNEKTIITNSARDKGLRERLLIFSIAFANFSTGPMDYIWQLLLVDVAATFQVTVGIAGQIRTASAIASILTGLLMGILSIRYKHKTLLFFGVLFMNISALGCFWAPSIGLLAFFNSLNGVGSLIVGAMAITLIGDFLPLQKRGGAVGVVQATTYLAGFVALPITGFVASIHGWRYVLLLFQLPVSVAGLTLAIFGLPPRRKEPRVEGSKETIFNGFKPVLLGRSPIGCLIGLVLRATGAFAITFYVVAFFREQFMLSEFFGVPLLMMGLLFMILSNLVAGKLVNRFGRKPLTVATTLLWAIFIVSFFYIPNLWISLILFFIGWWFGGMALSASVSLTLEQVPKFRGTMMSIHGVFLAIGGALASIIGGITIDLFSYQTLGLIVGLLSIVSAMVYHFLTVDPSTTSPKL